MSGARGVSPACDVSSVCGDFPGWTARFRLSSEGWGPSRVLAALQVSSHASAVGAQAREEYVRAVDAMAQKLRAAQYNGSYFDRSTKAGGRLCTPEGWFSCQVSGSPFPGAAGGC